MRTHRTILGLILGVLAGVGFVMVPALLSQTGLNNGSDNGYGFLGQPNRMGPAQYQRQLYGVSAASPLGMILLTIFIIFLLAITVSLVTRRLTIKKIGSILPEKKSEFELSDPS